ncbi:MAG: hypothetical protein WDN26_19855 [Chitinophagaceae bacterium]
MNINISGNTYIKTSGAALTNVPVEVNWFRKAYCIGCTSYKVVSGKSGNDGKFSFNTTIDSNFFKDYFLSVRVPADTNYITVPSSGGVNFNEERFYDFNQNSIQNLKFEFYPKTFLTIKLIEYSRTILITFLLTIISQVHLDMVTILLQDHNLPLTQLLKFKHLLISIQE